MDWLLFLHQIPPTPAYFRAKVMHRLHQLGAWPVKNSAYLLPFSNEAVEEFEWLRTEVEEQGGEAWLFRSEAIGGLSDETIQEAFRKLREPDYAALIESARELLKLQVTGERTRRPIPFRRRYEELHRIDFFGAPGREELESLMRQVEGTAAPSRPGASGPTAEFRARTWVTRKGVKVDRMGSAWLIRRFVDPAARFVFVDPRTYRHAEREIRFDMAGGEFTHEGDLCAFEVLVRFLGTVDAALGEVAEIVHDVDFRDGRFHRPETAGIRLLIDGIAARHADDLRRVEEGSTIFESLYSQLQYLAKGGH